MSSGEICSDCRDKWGPYIVVVNSPDLAASLDTKPAPSSPSAWLTMERAAAMMGFSYFWLSRNWKQLGLNPSSPRPGVKARRMFEAKEIDEFMRARKFTRRGRPSKIKELNA